MITIPVFPEKIAEFPELTIPHKFYIADNQIFIENYPNVYIYTLSPFKLMNKIGSAGEGPKEFKNALRIFLTDDYLAVWSHGKISYYTKKGKYLKERRILHSPGNVYKILADNFVSYSHLRDKGILYTTVRLSDSNFKTIKEIYRDEAWYSASKPKNAYGHNLHLLCRVAHNRIFLSNRDGEILIFDKAGTLIRKIEHKFDTVKVTEDEKQAYKKWFKEGRTFKEVYHRLKHLLVYPSTYPPIRHIYVADNKIYIMTFKKIAGKTEFVIFDFEGKVLKKAMLPLQYTNIEEFYWYTFKDDKFYNMVENEDTEEWELHVHDIK